MGSLTAEQLRSLINDLDFGSSTAEKDTILQTAHIETSVFNDIFYDRVDLILGYLFSVPSPMESITYGEAPRKSPWFSNLRFLRMRENA